MDLILIGIFSLIFYMMIELMFAGISIIVILCILGFIITAFINKRMEE